MKNVTVLSIVVASLLLVGCGEEPKETAKETAPVEKVEKKVATPKAEEKKVQEAKTATPEAKEESVSKKVEKATDAVADAGKAAISAVTQKTAEVASDAKKMVVDAVEKGAEVAKEVVAEKVASVDTKACAACHGANFEKKAMNVSKIVKDMTKADIITALKGYKDGSYGGAMKALMKGQVASYDEAKIEAVATQIGK